MSLAYMLEQLARRRCTPCRGACDVMCQQVDEERHVILVTPAAKPLFPAPDKLAQQAAGIVCSIYSIHNFRIVKYCFAVNGIGKEISSSFLLTPFCAEYGVLHKVITVRRSRPCHTFVECKLLLLGIHQ